MSQGRVAPLEKVDCAASGRDAVEVLLWWIEIVDAEGSDI